MATLIDLEQALSMDEPPDPDGSERVLAAVVLVANSNPRHLDTAAGLARIDWRDVLVVAGLENADWQSRLNAKLGTAD